MGIIYPPPPIFLFGHRSPVTERKLLGEEKRPIRFSVSHFGRLLLVGQSSSWTIFFLARRWWRVVIFLHQTMDTLGFSFVSVGTPSGCAQEIDAIERDMGVTDEAIREVTCYLFLVFKVTGTSYLGEELRGSGIWDRRSPYTKKCWLQATLLNYSFAQEHVHHHLGFDEPLSSPSSLCLHFAGVLVE
jgi:hypothetical protein